MIRWLRVVHSERRLTREAYCPYCGDLVFYLTDEELLWQRRSRPAQNPFYPPHAVGHDCRKFTTRQLLHNGRKPLG